MNPERLFAHFQRVVDALGGVTEIRSLIIRLAVTGKLVPHEDAGQSGPNLYADVRKGISELASTHQRCRWTRSEPIATVEKPFQLPPFWTWARLNDTGLYINGIAFKHADRKGAGTPIIRIQNLSDERKEFNFTAGKFSEENLVRNGDLLVSWSATLDAFVWRRREGVLNQHIFKVIVNQRAVTRDYLYWLLKHEIRGLAASDHAHGLVMKHINRGPFLAHIVPLPPLAEQHRIVSKVNELMALCDRLQGAQDERDRQRDRLTAASHYHLNNSVNAEAASEYAKFYLSHLPRVTTCIEHVKQLRRTILNLAVRGRLVQQNSSDEPAPSFGVAGDAGKDRLDLDLPDGWSWGTVEDVAEARLGKMLDQAKNSGKRFRYLRNTNVHWFEVRIDELKELKIEESEVERYQLRRGDVLICEGGHGIGRTAVWHNDERDIVFQKALHRVRPGAALNSTFFSYCMFVYFHAGVLQTYFTGVGIPHFTGRALASLVFPLPPFAEQHRIVARVTELMSLCDQLESQLSSARSQSHQLLEAVLHHALKETFETAPLAELSRVL